MGTTAEVYPYAVLCQLLALLLLLRSKRQSWGVLFVVSMLAALAVLFHQSAIFFVFALVVFIAAQSRSLFPAAFVALISGALTLTVYIYAATENEVQDVAGFWHWIFFYAHSEQYAAGTWGSGLAVSRLSEILVGVFSTVVKPDAHKYMIKQRLITDWTDFVLVPSAALLLMAAFLTARWLWQYRKTIVTRQSVALRPLRLMLVLWLLGGGLFVAWWDQSNIEFWYMLVAPALILFALRLHTLAQQGVRLSPAPFILAASLLMANLAARVYADAQPSRSIAAGVISAIGCEHFANGDLVIGPIWDLPPAIRYQCEKNTETASIHQAAHEPLEKERALKRYAQLLFAGHKHVYFLETELVPTVRNTYFSSAWQDDEVEAFYRPLLIGARPLGTFNLLGTQYQIYELQPRQ